MCEGVFVNDCGIVRGVSVCVFVSLCMFVLCVWCVGVYLSVYGCMCVCMCLHEPINTRTHVCVNVGGFVCRRECACVFIAYQFLSA